MAVGLYLSLALGGQSAPPRASRAPPAAAWAGGAGILLLRVPVRRRQCRTCTRQRQTARGITGFVRLRRHTRRLRSALAERTRDSLRSLMGKWKYTRDKRPH